jgi:hypothetical protein
MGGKWWQNRPPWITATGNRNHGYAILIRVSACVILRLQHAGLSYRVCYGVILGSYRVMDAKAVVGGFGFPVGIEQGTGSSFLVCGFVRS